MSTAIDPCHGREWASGPRPRPSDRSGNRRTWKSGGRVPRDPQWKFEQALARRAGKLRCVIHPSYYGRVVKSSRNTELMGNQGTQWTAVGRGCSGSGRSGGLMSVELPRGTAHQTPPLAITSQPDGSQEPRRTRRCHPGSGSPAPLEPDSMAVKWRKSRVFIYLALTGRYIY